MVQVLSRYAEKGLIKGLWNLQLHVQRPHGSCSLTWIGALWVLYVKSGWVVSMRTWQKQKAIKPVTHSSFKFIAGWHCSGSEFDLFDMVTLPRYDNICILNKIENTLYHMAAYLRVTQHHIDTMCFLSGYTRHALCWVEPNQNLFSCISLMVCSTFGMAQWLNQVQSNHRKAN